MQSLKIGFGICGSFCTFHRIIPVMERLAAAGHEITPIMSAAAYFTDTRFGKCEEINRKITEICGKEIIHELKTAEPIGPKKLFDVMAVAPCTGNTLAKLAAGITDTPVTLAVKAHLRNLRPTVIAVSTNDALSGSAQNIGRLLNRKNIFFVPMKQDDPEKKPRSVVADFRKTGRYHRGGLSRAADTADFHIKKAAVT